MERHDRYRELAATLASFDRIELYLRSSNALRVAWVGDGSVAVDRGRDEGLAVRLDTGVAGRASFGAASGGEEGSLRRAVRSAFDAADVCGPAEWSARSEPAVRVDDDSVDDLPDPSEVEAWLRGALERVPGSPKPDRAWVEVAATEESWSTDGRWLAVRRRRRAWAMLRPAPGGGGSMTRPLWVGERNWERMPLDAWRERLADRRPTSGGTDAGALRRGLVAFGPEAAALLVSSVTRAMDVGRPESLDAGPGWVVADDPTRSGALFGGGFDDAGFPTRRVALADGRKVLAGIPGRGNYRRPSFRDPPLPFPAHLRVEPRETTAYDTGPWIAGLTIHPLPGGEWFLEVEGSVLEGGEPARSFAGRIIRTSPAELVRRCVAGSGPSRSSHRGVETPALLFDL